MPLLLLLLLLACLVGSAHADDELRRRLAERLSQPASEAARLDNQGRSRVAPAPAARGKPAPNWGYAGDLGPERWGALSPEWRLCAQGTRQSPIDLRDTLRVDQEPIAFDYRDGGFAIIDTGRTVEVRPAAGNALTLGGRRYLLRQLQFHRPGETRVGGVAPALSIHLLHEDAQGRRAMLAIPVQPGDADNLALAKLWGHLPLERQQLEPVPAGFNPAGLLPTERGYFKFMGSLTTPPCTEGVLWLVLREPLRASAQQIEVFARLYPMNARGLQPAGGRIVKESL